MFSKLMRGVCLLLGVTHLGLGVVALRAGDWLRGVEAFAIVLLAFLLWFAAPPGAAALERPHFGTRSLRLGLYYALIGLAAISGFAFLWDTSDAATARHTGSSSLLLLIILFLVPLMQAERREQTTP